MDTLAYVVCAVTGTILLGTISSFYSYKLTMDEKYKYMYNRVESLYERFEKIMIDRHEELQQQTSHNNLYVIPEPNVPLLDPVNYSTHPLMSYDKDVYITM